MPTNLAGFAFYRKKGYKTITIYLQGDVHKRLLKFARDEGRSLQKTVERLIEEKLKKA